MSYVIKIEQYAHGNSDGTSHDINYFTRIDVVDEGHYPGAKIFTDKTSKTLELHERWLAYKWMESHSHVVHKAATPAERELWTKAILSAIVKKLHEYDNHPLNQVFTKSGYYIYNEEVQQFVPHWENSEYYKKEMGKIKNAHKKETEDQRKHYEDMLRMRKNEIYSLKESLEESREYISKKEKEVYNLCEKHNIEVDCLSRENEKLYTLLRNPPSYIEKIREAVALAGEIRNYKLKTALQLHAVRKYNLNVFPETNHGRWGPDEYYSLVYIPELEAHDIPDHFEKYYSYIIPLPDEREWYDDDDYEDNDYYDEEYYGDIKTHLVSLSGEILGIEKEKVCEIFFSE